MHSWKELIHDKEFVDVPGGKLYDLCLGYFRDLIVHNEKHVCLNLESSIHKPYRYIVHNKTVLAGKCILSKKLFLFFHFNFCLEPKSGCIRYEKCHI